MNTVVNGSDMAVQATLNNINRRFDAMATKVDVEQMRNEEKCLTETLMEKIQQLEGRLFDIEVKTVNPESEVKPQKKVNETITGIVKR